MSVGVGVICQYCLQKCVGPTGVCRSRMDWLNVSLVAGRIGQECQQEHAKLVCRNSLVKTSVGAGGVGKECLEEWAGLFEFLSE